MRNLFGKIRVSEAGGVSSVIADEMGIPALAARAKEIVNKHKNTVPESAIADLVLDGLKKCIFFRRLVPENTDAELQEAIEQDLKLLMVASRYYYHYLYDKAGFKVINPVLPSFSENFRPTHLKSKKDALKAHGIPLPLPGIALERDTSQYYSQHSVLDIGLALGISTGTSGLTNPYLPHDSESLKIRTFLNGFSHAYIDRDDVEELYSLLPGVPTNFSMEAYAVLNQFCIERLTNLNFIVACYNLNARNHGFPLSHSLRKALEYWLLVPLLRARLLVLDMLYNGTYGLPGSLLSESILDLFDCVIPVACSVYEMLMAESGCEIQTDDNYFKQIYADPTKPGQNDKSRYMMFQITDRKQLEPVQKFIVTDDKILKNKLLECIGNDELDRLTAQWNTSHQEKERIDRRKHLKTAEDHIGFFKEFITEHYSQAIPKAYPGKARRLEKLKDRLADPGSYIMNITTGGKRVKPLPKTPKGLQGEAKQLESELQSMLDYVQARLSEDEHCPSLIDALARVNIAFAMKTGRFSDNGPYLLHNLDDYCNEGAVSRFCGFARTFFDHFNTVMTPHDKQNPSSPFHDHYRSSYSQIDFLSDTADFDCFDGYDEMVRSLKQSIIDYPAITDEIMEIYKKYNRLKEQAKHADERGSGL